MKKYYLTILFLLLFTLYGCKEGYEQPKEIDPKEFNEKIAYGTLTKAEWVKTPESIVKQLLPSGVHQEGNTSYSIEEKHFADTLRKVTMTKEGLFDDEVKGKKTIVDFKLKNEKWEITKMYISLKRRD